MVKIKIVQPGSISEKKGIKPDWNIISINGNEITDILDYRFYSTEKKLKLELLDENSNPKKLKIKKDEYDDIGLDFETYLMDKQRTCKNNCIFCFIDQMPKNMRPSLYFKDDDDRLSFLFGNYITLTNIDEKEIDRIIKMHISPVNISVHTTNPELRCKMMNNRFAGEKLQLMYKLAEGGIKLNCQLVLCPGINDGEELKKSLEDLTSLYPAVESIAAVPVGLTKFREGLAELKPYTKEKANEVIDIIDSFGNKMFNQYNDRVVYASDEFYNLAERKMPDEEFYGAMLQLENGVGMSALMKSQFTQAVDEEESECKGSKKTIATGKGAYNLIKSLVDYADEKWHNINCDVVAVENEFFGPLITTTGLITGTDLIKTLQGKDNIGTLLLSPAMLRSENDVFLDDITPQQVSEKIGAKVEIVGIDGASLLEALLK